MAVELVLDNEDTLAFSWAMDGLNEGLAIELRPSGHSSEKPDAVVDVTDRREWSAYLGASVTAVVPVWHVPNEECPKMPWAFRLEFSPSKILVVALGESQGSGFTYMPDSLVVLFDEETAAAYHIPASSAPALGHR